MEIQKVIKKLLVYGIISLLFGLTLHMPVTLATKVQTALSPKNKPPARFLVMHHTPNKSQK